MSTEIEKKYLLPEYPTQALENESITQISKTYIYQTYLAYSEDQEVRVRQLVDDHGVSQFTHTFKSGHGLVRQEIEYEISEAIYKQLLANTSFRPLEKIRTTVQHNDLQYEIDEYKQVNLTVVEVEFTDLDQANRFTAPDWFGRELGKEEEFRNKSMWIKLQTPEA
ncbi:CYTH domain protein [compost metagenome]